MPADEPSLDPTARRCRLQARGFRARVSSHQRYLAGSRALWPARKRSAAAARAKARCEHSGAGVAIVSLIAARKVRGCGGPACLIALRDVEPIPPVARTINEASRLGELRLQARCLRSLFGEESVEIIDRLPKPLA